MGITEGEWVVIDSGGRVMLKAVGKPQIICTLETMPLKITREIKANARLIAAAPKIKRQRDELLAACEVAVLALTHKPINPKDMAFIEQTITNAKK